VDKPGSPFQGVGIGRETYGPPRRQVASAVRPEQSAQTYPAFRRAVGQDGEPRVLVLIKGPASSAILRRRVPGHRLTVRPPSFGDGFSVPVVVLLRLDAGTNIFERHQPHLVARRGQRPSHMVSAAARLHRDDTRRCLGAECHHGVASHAAAEQNLAGCIQADEAAAVLADVHTDHRELHRSTPFSPSCSGSLSAAARGGAGHP